MSQSANISPTHSRSHVRSSGHTVDYNGVTFSSFVCNLEFLPLYPEYSDFFDTFLMSKYAISQAAF